MRREESRALSAAPLEWHLSPRWLQHRQFAAGGGVVDAGGGADVGDGDGARAGADYTCALDTLVFWIR